MTIFPFVVLVLCSALAALFEVAYYFITIRWSTPADRSIWTCILWLLVVVMTSVCQLIPHKLPESNGWGVIIVIAFLHIVMSLMGDGFHSVSRTSQTNPPKDRNIHKGQ